MNYIAKWFIDNPIAAKIIMMVIFVAGILSYPLLPKQFFPQTEVDIIKVSVVYPGAGPDEVESQVTKRIEEAIEQLGGIEEIRSIVREGITEVIIEVKSGEDTQRLLNDVRANVDAITTFPTGSERPQIVENRWQNTMMRLQLAGDIPERELKELGETIRDELAALPSVTIAELRSPRNYELGIEIAEARLLEYGISFNDVANAIRNYSFNLPGGKIRDVGGDIQLQTRAQANSAADFAAIPILRKADGGIIRVGDVATIVDGFEDLNVDSKLNGQRSLAIHIINQTRPNILTTSDEVLAYIDAKQSELPSAVTFKKWSNLAIPYRGRLNTLIKNGSSGLLLVFITLVLFLRPMLAFWVCSGIAVAFFGALWAMSLTPVSLNVVSMFSFIMILGIIVDDAIIVGESVHTQQSLTGDKRLGAIRGVRMIMAPVWFAVVSTIVFFVPFFFINETVNTAHIATPVILALIFSLIESLFLLPSHLAHSNKGGKGKESFVSQLRTEIGSWAIFKWVKNIFVKLDSWRVKVSDTLPMFAQTVYRRFLLRSISSRLYTLMVYGFFLIFSIGMIQGNWITFSFFPRVESNYTIATAKLPESAAYAQTYEIMRRLEASGEVLRKRLNEEYGYELILGTHALSLENTARVTLKLDDSSYRPLSSREVGRLWRELIGEVQGVTDLTVGFTIFDLPKPIGFSILSDSQYQLDNFSREFTDHLNKVEGIFDVRSSLENPSNEINFSLKSNASTLSTSLRDVSSQVRRAFFGEEVQRIPRQREDVKVFVRYPRELRSYEEALRNMKIITTAGESIPLESVVDIDYRNVYKKIDRLDGKRVANVSADLHTGFEAKIIVEEMARYFKEELSIKYPDVDINLEGEEKENQEFIQKLYLFLSVAIMVIYGLMAVMFRSYWQPVLVLSAIPFGFMGGVFGHFLFGKGMSLFSILGMLACAGVVVNDNVVLIDRINQLRKLGHSARNAVVNAGIQRFRPIVLTSLTTFVGLTPILLETSIQAQFLIPMVISLSFGVLCATTVTLVFVPSLYLVCNSFMHRLGVSSHPTSTKVEGIQAS